MLHSVTHIGQNSIKLTQNEFISEKLKMRYRSVVAISESSFIVSFVCRLDSAKMIAKYLSVFDMTYCV